jgi:protein-disulfide isomerase
MTRRTIRNQGFSMSRRVFTGGVFASALVAPVWADSLPSAAKLIRPGDPILGNPNGDVTITEFYDIRCPTCREIEPSFEKLLKSDSGIRYVPVDYPILGPASLLGVQALFAAQIQGKYAALREKMMRDSAPITLDMISAHAKSLSLNWQQMEFDMNGDAVSDRVAANLARGQSLELQGVPDIYINSIFVPGGLGYTDMTDLVGTARRQMQIEAKFHKKAS